MHLYPIIIDRHLNNTVVFSVFLACFDSNSLGGSARKSIHSKIGNKTENLKQLRNTIDADTRELNTLKAQLVVIAAKKSGRMRRKETHHPYYLLLGDNLLQKIVFFLNIFWLIMTIAALSVSPWRGLTSHLLWFIFSFTLIGIFDLDSLIPKLLSIPQMNFTWMYLAFRLATIDILGISVMCLRSDFLSEGFREHMQQRQHFHEVSVSQSNIEFTIVYFLFFYYWYIGRTLIMAPMKRAYPKLMVDMSLVSFLWSDLFLRMRGQEGRMSWKWFWTFQLSIKEAMYVGTISDPIFAVASGDVADNDVDNDDNDNDDNDDDSDDGGEGGGGRRRAVAGSKGTVQYGAPIALVSPKVYIL